MRRWWLCVVGALALGTLSTTSSAEAQEAYTPEVARDQLTSVLEELGDWYGLAMSRFGQSAWSLEADGGGGLTLLALTEAVAGHDVRLRFSPGPTTDDESSGYRVMVTDPQGDVEFDLHLHVGDAGQGHLPVLCPEEAEPGRPMGCLDVHGSGSGRSFEAAWGSNGEMRWLVAYRDAAGQVDSVLAVGRARIDRTFQRVVLSLSGGISYGSYQAGVNWAMVDMLKRLKYGELSRRTDHHDFGALRLAAATGASAGNINALFSALEWCDEAFIPPERSLFFRTWANIGFTQLLPQARYRDHASIRDTTGTPVPDSALFTRRFFKAVPFKEIGEKLAALSDSAGRSVEDCTTPVGVTLTRLLPGRLQLGLPPYEIPIETQRYTTIFRLAGSGPPQRPTVSFRQEPASSFEDPTLGKWMALDNGGVGDELSVNTVLGLVEAASAYPVAFAPITLDYEDARHGGLRAHPEWALPEAGPVHGRRHLRQQPARSGVLPSTWTSGSGRPHRRQPAAPVLERLAHEPGLLRRSRPKAREIWTRVMSRDSVAEVLGLDALDADDQGRDPHGSEIRTPVRRPFRFRRGSVLDPNHRSRITGVRRSPRGIRRVPRTPHARA